MNGIQGMAIMHHRRDILRGCLRWGGLLVLGGGASLLGWRGARGTCPRGNPCGACPLFTDCRLPGAMDKKNNGAATPSAAASNKKPGSKHV